MWCLALLLVLGGVYRYTGSSQAAEQNASSDYVSVPTVDGQAVLPPRQRAFKIGTIGAMTIGQKGWVKSWAICQSDFGHMWLDANYSDIPPVKGGSFVAYIERTQDGFLVRDEDPKRHWKVLTGRYDEWSGNVVKVVKMDYNTAQDLQPQ